MVGSNGSRAFLKFLLLDFSFSTHIVCVVRILSSIFLIVCKNFGFKSLTWHIFCYYSIDKLDKETWNLELIKGNLQISSHLDLEKRWFLCWFQELVLVDVLSYHQALA